jgi:hypothetical protein
VTVGGAVQLRSGLAASDPASPPGSLLTLPHAAKPTNKLASTQPRWTR